MLDINLIKAWLAYMDIGLVDIILFIVLILLIIMGLYVAIKKNLFLGLGQILLALLTPYSICVFFITHKEFWEIEKKTWITLLTPFDYTSNNTAFISMAILILTPLFIIITFNCIKTALTKNEK